MFDFLIDTYINGKGWLAAESITAPFTVSLLSIDLIILICVLAFLLLSSWDAKSDGATPRGASETLNR